MNVADFIAEFRATVCDVELPHFWSSELIVRYLNEAVQEACERAKLIEDRTTPVVCSIALQAGESTYALHPSILEIKRATIGGRRLDETSVEAMDADCPGWESLQGTPRAYIFEQASGGSPARIRLVRTPADAETLSLTVYRGALKPLSADLDTGKPEIPERFHERLMDWVLHRAYLKQDADTFDPNKAAVSLGLFVQSFGARPDANVQRKQRDRRPPVVRSNW